MSIYLIALTGSGGVPLYSRNIGESSLSYPVVGSLNGVHMYGKGGDIELQSAFSENCHVCWKSFHESITLILVSDKSLYAKNQLQCLLRLACNTMIMLYGNEELITIKNVERFKRDIRVCYGLLDYLLKLYSTHSFSDLTNCVDVLTTKSTDLLQNYLNGFTESASSLHGCLIIDGRVVVSTHEWCNLDRDEQILICHLVNSLPQISAARDIPIYLPKTSPSIAQRLVTITLVPGVEVCLLCGPTPSLGQLEKEVERFWVSALDTLKTVQNQAVRNIPKDVSLDPNVLGLLFTNQSSGKAMACYQPEQADYRQAGSSMEIEARRTALRTFIATAHSICPSFISNNEDQEQMKPVEAYCCTDEYKSFAIHQAPYKIYIIFSTRVPVYALGSVAKKLLAQFIKEKYLL